MGILDKNKDYYDYLSFSEISDKTRIFDIIGHWIAFMKGE